MRIRYQNVLVVEGKTDKDLLSSFLDADIVTTNGSEVSRETIDYIKELSKTRTIVVLTDPDAPGKRIRDILNREIPGIQNAFIPKRKAIKKHKVGVAESDKDTIMEALNNIMVVGRNDHKSDIEMIDLFDLGLIGHKESAKKRETLEEKLHIDQVNGKTLLKRLIALGITKKELEEAIDNGRE